jgi:hypothetical protein
VQVVTGKGPDFVIVDVNNASSDEVLQALASQFQFEVERSSQLDGAIRFSGRLQGSLQLILERILRNEGYTIVRASGAESTISRVVILDPKRGTGASGIGKAGTTDRAPGGPAPANAPVAAPSAPGPAGPTPPPQVWTSAHAPAKPITTTEPTLRQLEQLGRQMISMDEQRRAQDTGGSGDSPAVPSASVASIAPDAQQRLTQEAVSNVQSLVTSLRAACIGESCRR